MSTRPCYQDVWVRVFALIYARDHVDSVEEHATKRADAAAAAAVRKWDESKRLAAITTKNQENP